MAGLLTDKEYKDLREAVRDSDDKLNVFRETRTEMIREYVGSHYSDQGADFDVIVNFLELFVNTHRRQLAARAPRAMVHTRRRELKPMAADFKLALDHLSKEIDLGTTLGHVVLDALFSIGIAKVGINDLGFESRGYLNDVGQPFCERVSLDNWVHDTNAESWDEIQFCGDRYRLPLAYLKNSGLYDAEALEQLEKNGGFDSRGSDSDKAGYIGTNSPYQDEFVPHVELLDLWLPMHGLFVTIPTRENANLKPLIEREWNGPERGPYAILSFNDVPDNLMPASSVSFIYDLHLLGNKIFRQLRRQAEREKQIGIATQGDEEAAKRITDASDGEVVLGGSTGQNPVQEIKYGGPDNNSLAFFIQVKNLFSWFGGNIDTLAGLSPMADTVGQERLLAQAATTRVADMQDRTIAFAKRIMEDLGYWLWNDPFIKLPLTKRIPGTNVEINFEWGPEQRENDFSEYNLDIIPYSMEHTSPPEQLQKINLFMERIILPLYPMMQQAGVTINFEALIRKYEELANVPELSDILDFASQTVYQPELVGQPPQKQQEMAAPQNTHRTYERINRPGTTRPAQDAIVMSALLGGNNQRSVASAMDRPIG